MEIGKPVLEAHEGCWQLFWGYRMELGALQGHFGDLWGHVRDTWGAAGDTEERLGDIGAHLGTPEAVWVTFRGVSAVLGPFGGRLGIIRGIFRGILGV